MFKIMHSLSNPGHLFDKDLLKMEFSLMSSPDNCAKSDVNHIEYIDYCLLL